MSKAIRIYETGGPEVMRWEDHDPGDPGPDEVRLRHEAVGLNFIDVYHRNGLYLLRFYTRKPILQNTSGRSPKGKAWTLYTTVWARTRS